MDSSVLRVLLTLLRTSSKHSAECPQGRTEGSPDRGQPQTAVSSTVYRTVPHRERPHRELRRALELPELPEACRLGGRGAAHHRLGGGGGRVGRQVADHHDRHVGRAAEHAREPAAPRRRAKLCDPAMHAWLDGGRRGGRGGCAAIQKRTSRHGRLRVPPPPRPAGHPRRRGQPTRRRRHRPVGAAATCRRPWRRAGCRTGRARAGRPSCRRRR